MKSPKLSVIVVCIYHGAGLERCLSALAPQLDAEDVEVIAIGHDDARADGGELESRYPAIVWLSVSSDVTVPEMRLEALKRSRGEIVALLEDDCAVTTDWCREVVRAHQAPFLAIGGPIEPASSYRPADWAVYFCEYGRFMPPFSGIVAALPGNNVSYKRRALDSLKDEVGLYDVFFHARLRQSGEVLYAEPNLAVRNVNRWSLAHLTVVPFHHGRAFAGKRATDFPRWRRLGYGALAGGLPLVKVGRVAREVFRRRRYEAELLRALPWVGAFMLSWSAGEFIGYLLGAGASASRWR